MRITFTVGCLLWLSVLSAAAQEEATVDANDASLGVEIADVHLIGRLEEGQLGLRIEFEAETDRRQRKVTLLRGEAVLDQMDPSLQGVRLDYICEKERYTLAWPRKGHHHFAAAFKLRSVQTPDDLWREAQLQVPLGRRRHITLTCQRPDLEVQLPGALQVEQEIVSGERVITGILGPHQPLVIRWKPQVQLEAAELVVSSRANTIVEVGSGLLRLDSIFDFQVAQGKIETLRFTLPDTLHVHSVEGLHIRHWELRRDAEGAPQLMVELNRPQEADYRLHIRAEAALPQLPTEVAVPVISPQAGIRAGGHLVLGTDNALQLVVLQASGLTQIDAAAFPRLQSVSAAGRRLPQGKAFYYSYAGSHYQLQLAVDDVVPAYDVSGHLVTRMKEDDLLLDADLEFDIRDAPLRQCDILIPAGLAVSSVEGKAVEDYRLVSGAGQDPSTRLRVLFGEPVLGRTLVHLELELGRGPLEQAQTIEALQVQGAKTVRGYVVVATEPGIELDTPDVLNLREVHAASVPLRVDEARYAYRFRQADWRLTLLGRPKPAGIRCEVFHLQSIGEALAYGSAVINYIITGSPVDELRFRLPTALENVEFVGRDVRRFQEETGLWTVKLARKVIGDYSLAVTYTQRYGPDLPIQLGSLRCEGVATQTGYVAVTSRLDLALELETDPATTAQGLHPIAMDELPADYRLLTSSPILSTYRYVTNPDVAALRIAPQRRGTLLPVVVDMAAHQTKLAVRPDGRVESVTTVRYKVKNSSAQFLSLVLPPDAQVWAVREIDEGRPDAEPSRLAISRDVEGGSLLIPLRRRSNPNDPATIELEYGQVHPTGGNWARRIDLSAPACTVPMAYADWQVTVPSRWAISAEGPHSETAGDGHRADLSGILRRSAALWSAGLSTWGRQVLAWAALSALIVAAALCFLFRRSWLPPLLALGLLGLWLSLGIVAAQQGDLGRPSVQTQLTVARAVTTQQEQAFSVAARLVPAWRQNLSLAECLGVSLLAVAALALGVMLKRLRWVAAAALLTDGLFLAAKLPATWPVLHALLTWGLPAGLGLWRLLSLLSKARLRPMPVAPITAMIVLTLPTLLLGGCSGTAAQIDAALGTATVRQVTCAATAGRDSVELVYRFQIDAEDSTRVALLADSALLVSPAEPDRDVTVETDAGQHWLRIARRGHYEVALTFLRALPEPDDEQRRGLSIALPIALTNQVSFSVPDANVDMSAPSAISVTQKDEPDRVTLHAMFRPGQTARFEWRPKERQAAQEETRFFARDKALADVTSGLVRVYHALDLQIAQGQLDHLSLTLAGGETVTEVQAEALGDWRFDPETGQLEVKLARPISGQYALRVVTQLAYDVTPHLLSLTPLRVPEASYQHNVLGLATDESVYVQIGQSPAAMNTRDFIRDNQALLGTVAGFKEDHLVKAFRFDTPEERVSGQVFPVESEVRSEENARFSVEDDRLIYNSEWRIDIAKAGRFDLDLILPEGFDIDSVAATGMSHWDETPQGTERRLKIHFLQKRMGPLELKLALSHPLAQMPTQIAAPRVTIDGDLKHTGRLLVSSEQGVRLSVSAREGVSELNPAELGLQTQGLLAFKLLRPQWRLQLQTEVLDPRITVEGLHVAQVTEGLVRHQHTLRYRLMHAGSKTFHLTLPPDATGAAFTGPGITRREEIAPGRWRIELADKVFDRPYLLRVSYETRYDPGNGSVTLPPVRCEEADLQQGHTVVYAADRVELRAQPTDTTMRPADPRRVPNFFGAGDLAGAAMCYRSASADQVLALAVTRHVAAAQIGAEVRKTDIRTVVTEEGQTLNHVILTMAVGDLRYLQATLPINSTLWSAAVEGQGVQPSVRNVNATEETLLMPLPQQAPGDVTVELIYIAGLPGVGQSPWSGPKALSGPRFNLPLKQIDWQLYCPEGFDYGNMGGSLNFEREGSNEAAVQAFTLHAYEQTRRTIERSNELQATAAQALAQELAQQGQQEAARQVLAKGFNYSLGNTALNEDIRVDLDNLLRSQVKVGLMESRGRLRRQAAGVDIGTEGDTLSPAGVPRPIDRDKASRLAGALSQPENENLELITRHIIQTQQAAAAPVEQLQITLPTQGRRLHFTSPLQVETDTDMRVGFEVSEPVLSSVDPSVGYGIAVFVLLLVARALWLGTGRGWERLQLVMTATPGALNQAVEASDDEKEEEEDRGPISADEL